MERHRHLLEPRVFADNLRRAAPLGELLLEKDVLGRHAPLRERALDHEQQMIGVHRLLEEVERPLLHRVHGVGHAAERRHHDDRQLGIELLRGAQDAEAVARRKAQIGKHDGGPRREQRRDRLRLIARFDDDVPLRFEREAQHRTE